MHGIRRVAIFCTLTTVLPTLLLIIPLYLRHGLYADVIYAVTESDILEIDAGISTIFCSEHTLRMNESFNAFQMAQKPEITSYRKHIRLKKSMILPDDTLEYWGFYLLKGATVALSVCSRFQGASILVVKGERNLRTCGMLDHNENKARATGIYLPQANQQVKVTFETNAQIINSREVAKSRINEGLELTKFNNVKRGIQVTSNSGNDDNISVLIVNESTKLANKNRMHSITNSLSNVQTEIVPVENQKLETLFRTAESYVQKHINQEQTRGENITRKLRHARKRLHRVTIERDRKEKEKEIYEQKLKDLLEKKGNVKNREDNEKGQSQLVSKEKQRRLVRQLELHLNSYDNSEEIEVEDEEERKERNLVRFKRNQDPVKPPALLDRGIKHGGNAVRNATDSNEESSVSSFENGLLNCYEGQVLLTQEFEPSELCMNVSYLANGKHMQTRHDVAEDGYYYYIFYSDNDFVSNDIHAVFNIYKPTFQYENVTKSCVNKTKCFFSLGLMSSDRVIVEVPTRDGIDHEGDDIALLISTCHPRMGIYVIFPVAVLFLVLSCAFM